MRAPVPMAQPSVIIAPPSTCAFMPMAQPVRYASRPMRAPDRIAAASMRVPLPMRAPAPMAAYTPMCAPDSIRHSGAIHAVGWT